MVECGMERPTQKKLVVTKNLMACLHCTQYVSEFFYFIKKNEFSDIALTCLRTYPHINTYLTRYEIENEVSVLHS